MFKKTITTALIIVSVLGSTTAFGEAKLADPVKGQLMISVIVNGNKVQFPDTEPFIDANNRTMVPVRFVSEKLGGEVKWDDKTRTVTISYGTKVISMPLDSKDVSIDGTTITLDTAAVLSEGRTMVPLRFVSEAMDTTVTWDGDAHYVKVNDKAFQASVDSGEIKLDPWGRELAPAPAPSVSANWNVLTDIPSFAYEVGTGQMDDADLTNKEYFDVMELMASKDILDRWSNKIRGYYLTVLNVDFRIINEDEFISSIKDLINYGDSDYVLPAVMKSLRNYVKFVKVNHIVTRGYADPEPYLTRYQNTRPVVRVRYKFEIIQSDDKTQSVLDSYNVGISDKIEFKKGLWYTGYSDVILGTNYGNNIEYHYALGAKLENMFQTGKYKYEVLK